MTVEGIERNKVKKKQQSEFYIFTSSCNIN